MTHPYHGAPATAHPSNGRRGFMVAASSVGVGAVAGFAATAPAGASSEAITYEVRRSDQEWRARLSDFDYYILRNGGTEQRRSSPLWASTAKGRYRCKGCDLTSYDGRWKVVLEYGWVFFQHAEPNAVLTSIDGPVPEYGSMANAAQSAFIEVHCRRCGSHLGHLLQIDGQLLHCINGASLQFQPEAS